MKNSGDTRGRPEPQHSRERQADAAEPLGLAAQIERVSATPATTAVDPAITKMLAELPPVDVEDPAMKKLLAKMPPVDVEETDPGSESTEPDTEARDPESEPARDDQEASHKCELPSMPKSSALGQRAKGDALTDLMLAELLVQMHGEDLRYCAALGWLVFDGERWVRDESGAVHRRAKGVVRLFTEQARASLRLADAAVTAGGANEILADARRKLKDALKAQSKRSLTAMVDLAASEPGIPVTVSDFDKDPWLFNCQNGTVDLRTGTLRDHCRDDLLMQMAGVSFDPKAQCPLWKQHLGEVFAGADCESVAAYVQRMTGYTLTGLTSEEVFFLLWGDGRNGKGTIVETIQKALGTYAKTAPMSLFLEQKYDNSKGYIIASMMGARMVVASESSEGKAFDLAVIKNWTGGDRRTGAHKYKPQFEYDPQDTPWILTNAKPKVKSWDLAFEDRLHLLPFEHSFTKEAGNRDQNRKADLLAELPGILAWAVRGCLAWQVQGLNPPERVKSAVDSYRTESTRASEFIEAHLKKVAKGSLRQFDVYKEYRQWSLALGHPLVQDTKFGEFLEAAGFLRSKRNDGQRILKCAWIDGTSPKSTHNRVVS